MTKFLLAHDLGTSGNKATLFSEAGELVASKVAAYNTNYFNNNWAEQNPNDWWEAVCTSTQELLSAAGVAAKDVAAVSLSGQMMGCTCVDEKGAALRPSMIYCDSRSTAQAEALLEKISLADAYQICGHRLAPVYSLEKLMWVRDNESETFAKTHKVLCAKDYINYHLTGKFATDYSDASGMNAFDLNTQDWSDTLLDIAGIDKALFPTPYDSTHILGGLTSAAAKATGLAEGTPVALGGGDGSCAGVGVGCIAPGTSYNYLGSSSWVALTVEKPIVDPQMRTMNWAHVVPGYLHPSGSVQTAGSAYSWLKNEICLTESQGDGNAYEAINALIEKSPPGANGLFFLPYLLGERSPRWNPNARGAFVGLTLASKRADIARAVMEGVTYNLGIIVDIFRQHVPIEKMTVIGGGAKGQVWLQMMADIYDVEVQRPNFLEEATSMGAAVVGGVGAGVFEDFSVIDRFIKIEETVQPNAENQKAYNAIKPIFDKAYFALEDVFEDLA